MKGINLLACKGPHYRQKKFGLNFFLLGLIGLLFLSAVLLNFFLADQIKQLKLRNNRLSDRLSSLSLYIEKLKKEQEKFKLSGVNNKNIQFMDKNSLKNYSITQFKMVGFFRGGFIEKKWALLKLPNKHFYKVEVNDELGLERGHVTFIDEKRIIVNGMDNKKIELSINK